MVPPKRCSPALAFGVAVLAAGAWAACVDEAQTAEGTETSLASTPTQLSQEPEKSAAISRLAPATRPVALTRGHLGLRREHRLPHGSCVTVIPPPPAWAFRPDGSLAPPSEIHRHKDGAEQILYLNIDGAHISPGRDNPEENTSFIPYSAVDIPAFDDVPFRTTALDSRDRVVYALVQWVTYFYAQTSVKVTSRRPAAGTPYTMVLVGGSPQLLGESTGVLGIGTFDCYQDANNVAFVFSEDHGTDLEMLVLTIVHEAAHTFGLAHINEQGSIMYPMNSGGNGHWGSGQTVDSRACDDSNSQDDLAVLQAMLGARTDGIPPWVEILTPGHGAVVPSSVDVKVHGTDNVVLYQVELFLDEASKGISTLPDFSFRLQGLTDGPHTLWAVGEDGHGNQGMSAAISVQVEANCSGLGTCQEGLGAVGEACTAAVDCLSAVCAQTQDGAAVCAKPCGPEDPCPLGTLCMTEAPTEEVPDPPAWCASGTPPAVVLRATDDSPHALSGCAGGGPSGLPALLLVPLLFLWARRRR